MSTSTTATLLRHLRQWAAGGGDDPHSDRELLRRFAAQRDEDAFAALVRRHGPMVWSVCRRILPQLQDAEDAFQATFLVLLRRAASHTWRDSIGGWLHGVATRIALHLRADGARRAAEMPPLEETIAADPLEQVTARELFAAFDEELARLPERYRAALVLCCLQGKTQEETSRQLGCSLSTIRRRLEHGRHLLHVRLTGRGLELPAAMGAVLLSKEATAAVPPLLRASVMQLVGGSVSARIAVLAESVVQTAVLTPMKTTALVLLLGVLAGGVGVTASHFLAMKAPQSEIAADALPDKPKIETTERTDLYGDPLPPRALLRMGTVRFRHHNVIGNVAFSPNGKWLAAASHEGVILLYDSVTGRKIRQLQSNAPYFSALAFAPDGKTLASAGPKAIQFWDAQTGKELRRFAAEAASLWGVVIPLVFSSDGKKLASVGPDKSVRVWEVKSGKEITRLKGLQHWVHSLVFSADGKTLYSAAAEAFGIVPGGTVRAWDVAAGKEIKTISLPKHPNGRGPATPLGFSPDGKTLAFANGEQRSDGFDQQTVYFLDLATEQARRSKLEPEKEGHFNFAVFSPDGKSLATLNEVPWVVGKTYHSFAGSNRVKVWDIATGKKQYEFSFADDRDGSHCPCRLAFAPDGKRLALSSFRFLARVWDLNDLAQAMKSQSHEDQVLCVAYSPDGRTLASASADNSIAVWDAATGAQRLRLRRRGPWASIASLAFSPDGKRLASASHNPVQAVELWDAATGKELQHFEVPGACFDGRQSWSVYAWVVFTAGGKQLAAAGTDRKLHLWDAATGQEMRYQTVRGLERPANVKPDDFFSQPPYRVQNIAFSPDGRLMALHAGRIVSIVDVAAGQLLLQFERKRTASGIGPVFVLSPDGKTLLSEGGKSVRIIETAGGADLYQLALPAEVSAAAFSIDGRRLAVSSSKAGSTIHLFDVPSAKELLRLQGHKSPTRALAFAPDGTKLASGQSDTTALIWDISAAQCKLPKSDLTTKDPERLWADLRAADAVRAYAALWMLVAAPDQAVPFLRQHLHLVPRVGQDRLRQLIADLDSDEFTRREEASRQLAKLGSEVEPALRKALESKPSLETRRRAEVLLKDLTCQTEMTADALRQLRAIQVLEQIGSPEARNILNSLAQGTPAAPATRDATAALRRLDRRAAGR